MGKTTSTAREVVGILATRLEFEQAVGALRAAGFDRTDISILASHDSLDAAESGGRSWRTKLLALFGELKYEGPLIAAGFIGVAAAPEGAALAALIAAGVGGAALHELMGELTAKPHSDEFARALAGGSILLWVTVADDDAEARASETLKAAGAGNVHTHERQA